MAESNILDHTPDISNTPFKMPWLEPQEGHRVNEVKEVVPEATSTAIISAVREADPEAPKKKKKKKAESEDRVREEMRKFFQGNWKTLAEATMEIIQDEGCKPSERMQAIKTAMEFGFGRAATQEPITTSKVPELKIGNFPSVAEMKARGTAQQTKPH